MRAPNYQLALALAQAGWNNAETARRLNRRAAERGHLGLAVDRSRVGRWIRHGERPRSPIPDLLADLLTEHLGQPYTPVNLGIGPAHAILVVLNETEHQALARHAAAANLTLARLAGALLRNALGQSGSLSGFGQRLVQSDTDPLDPRC
ncbi:hypothetical protein [Streptomyces murinus]|uniref:hypothetical protein n=1 Tax=Streptomyces murinus TaxID=33900 RepID=UPI0037F33B84